MSEVITIGVDLAKNVFQVHGIDAAGGVVVRRQLRRAQMLPFFKKQEPWTYATSSPTKEVKDCGTVTVSTNRLSRGYYAPEPCVPALGAP
jgi:transposase